jgi:hypothetical protein
MEKKGWLLPVIVVGRSLEDMLNMTEYEAIKKVKEFVKKRQIIIKDNSVNVNKNCREISLISYTNQTVIQLPLNQKIASSTTRLY